MSRELGRARDATLAIFVCVVASAALVTDARAEEYRSAFGFTASFPSGWIILTRAQLRANSSLFEGMDSPPGLQGVDSNLLAGAAETIRQGDVEMAFRTPIDSIFADNFNATAQAGQLPGQVELPEFCRQTVSMLSHHFGRPIALHDCGLRQVGERKALYLDFDGMAPGTRSLQVQIQKAPDSIVIVTATAKNERMAPLRRDFEAVIASLRFDASG